MINEIDEFYGTCCFCNENIRITKIDPCSIYITGSWNADTGRRALSEFFYHFSCLERYLHECCIEGYNHESSGPNFKCCFCSNEVFSECVADLRNIRGIDAWGRAKNQLFDQMHCFHVSCLKKHAYPSLRELFVKEILL